MIETRVTARAAPFRYPFAVIPRQRLRSRVFVLTAFYALILVGLAFVLSWRARVYEYEFNRRLSSESKSIDTLGELQRNQNAWRSRWRALANAPGSEARKLAGRYHSILQMTKLDEVRAIEDRSLEKAVRDLSAYANREATRWDDLTTDERIARIATIGKLSNAISEHAEILIKAKRKDADATIDRLAREAAGTMWTALGVAWIIAMVSFVVARRTLAKVVRPLEDLSLAAERIAAGDLTTRAPVGGDREIAHLGESFNHMAGALQESYAELGRRARTDDLTSLPNFRAFREALDAEIERSDRYAKSFGVLILDLDHFKKYNDTWGHLAGNEALQLVARTIREHVRNIDQPARYGGEEFAVIVPETDETGLAKLAERIRVAIAALPPLEDRARVTVSIGGAIFPDEGATPEDLFAVADERLYEAKEAGRNRAIVA